MSNHKQSSLELFALSLYEKGLLQGNGNHIDDLLLHFKAMHKEESISYAEDFGKQMLENKRFVNAEIIYNETYGGNNEQQ